MSTIAIPPTPNAGSGVPSSRNRDEDEVVLAPVLRRCSEWPATRTDPSRATCAACAELSKRLSLSRLTPPAPNDGSSSAPAARGAATSAAHTQSAAHTPTRRLRPDI